MCSLHAHIRPKVCQCPKLSFYFVHSQGALTLKLCTRKLFHAPSQYIEMINCSKNVHTPGAHLRKSCTRPWKCARRVQGAPLISDTVCGCTHLMSVDRFTSDPALGYWISLLWSTRGRPLSLGPQLYTTTQVTTR